jgi:cytolysin-activating lysine-acyltransferase
MFFKRSEAKPEAAKPPAAEPPPAPSPVPVVSTATAAKQPAQGDIGDAAPAGGVKPEQVAAMNAASAAFGQIVSMLMCSPASRKMSLGDLEWLVAPAIRHGQYILAHARLGTSGRIEPIGFVLWGLVSPEVDKRLSDTDAPMRLTPADWRSGDIPWVISGVGDQKILSGLLHQLTTTVFMGRDVKMRAHGADGKVTAGRIEILATAP